MNGIILVTFVTTFVLAAAKFPYRLWTTYKDGNGNYIIPYEFDRAYDLKYRRRVLTRMHEIANNTCIRFQERTKEFKHEYLVIKQGERCLAWFAGAPGHRNHPTRNAVNLNYNGKHPYAYCLDRYTALHELLHVIGLDHATANLLRDNYMKKHKITPEYRKKHPIDFQSKVDFKWVCEIYKCRKCPHSVMNN